jgi:hypothetical protein
MQRGHSWNPDLFRQFLRAKRTNSMPPESYLSPGTWCTEQSKSREKKDSLFPVNLMYASSRSRAIGKSARKTRKIAVRKYGKYYNYIRLHRFEGTRSAPLSSSTNPKIGVPMVVFPLENSNNRPKIIRLKTLFSPFLSCTYVQFSNSGHWLGF